MTGEIIKSFLVGLSFDVDDASLAKFNKSIVAATVKITALYTSVQLATAGIFKGISGMASSFEDIGYELRLVAPAINKMLILRQAMLSAYSRAGIDLTKVVKQSILFNMSLAKTKFALEAVYKSVGAKFLPVLTKQMDIFRSKIFANMPKIQDSLMKFVGFIFKAFDATIQLGTRVWSILGRVWDFFKELDAATHGWSTTLLELIAAWKLLSLEFLATPLGMVIAGLVGILALFDDFKTWQEGGKSLFDWSSFVPVINAVKDALAGMKGILDDIMQTVFGLFDAFTGLFTMDFSRFKNAIENTFGSIVDVLSKVLPLINSIFNVSGSLTNWAAKNLGSTSPTLTGINQPAPLVAGGAGNNQKVSQETNILVQGSADANSVGKAVASQQDKVNFDMVRNMRGAMR